MKKIETRGRKGLYETKIKPFLEDIKTQLGQGPSEEDLAKFYDISYASWKNYKRDHKEFREIIEKSKDRQKFDLICNAFKVSMGYEYTETTVVTEKRGEDITIRKTVATKYARPDSGMLQFLLINRFYNEFAKDPHAVALRKEALALQKKGIIYEDYEVL
jgi:hypothetical protein